MFLGVLQYEMKLRASLPRWMDGPGRSFLPTAPRESCVALNLSGWTAALMGRSTAVHRLKVDNRPTEGKSVTSSLIPPPLLLEIIANLFTNFPEKRNRLIVLHKSTKISIKKLYFNLLLINIQFSSLFIYIITLLQISLR